MGVRSHLPGAVRGAGGPENARNQGLWATNQPLAWGLERVSVVSIAVHRSGVVLDLRIELA